MDKLSKIQEKLIFIYLALFPFGQLLRNEIHFGEKSVAIYPTDLIIIFSGVLLLPYIPKLTKDFKNSFFFLVISVFSLLFSFLVFKIIDFSAIFYLLRIFFYFLLAINIYTLFKNSQKQKNLLLNCLLILSITVAIFGWIQYLILPDTRFLYSIGWDDHYFRLISTFLDPTFTGIILVFGFLITLIKTKKEKSIKNFLLLLFLFVTIGFTYSRSSYLALFFGAITIFANSQKTKYFIVIVFAFIGLVFLLPRPSSEGVKLERLNSVILKIENYHDSFEIIQKSPVFGVGLDNICQIKKIYLNEKNINSHSCSGLDNSFLFIWATTGIIGLAALLKLLIKIIKNSSNDEYGYSLIACLIALLIHSMFTNTLFYPWVMGYITVLIGISRKFIAKK